MKRNHYEKKRKHIRDLKKKHAVDSGAFDCNEDKINSQKELKESQASDPRNDGYYYWKRVFISDRRSCAKTCTNGRIRARYRSLIANKNFEDIIGYKNSDYEKEYDYNGGVRLDGRS